MKKILAFEGDQELTNKLRKELWRYGCALEAVHDANEGLEKALRERPDLILLTIELPRINGFSVCNKLKRNRTLKKIPLILLSSECSNETFQEHKKMQTAADGYVHKPFKFEELISVVRELIPITLLSPTELAKIEAAVQSGVFRTGNGGSVAFDDEAMASFSPIPPLPFSSVTSTSPVPSTDDSSPPESNRSKPIMQRKMFVLYSPDSTVRGQCFSFPDDGTQILTFGKEIDNSVIVNDRTVSTNHLLVESKSRSISVRDLGSGNGTFVNDELISHQDLRGGELVRFGETIMLYLRSLDVESQLERIIRELSERDPMLRVYSYYRIREKLEKRLEVARQEMTSLSLAAVAVDHLNQIAYRYGDWLAQRVLQETANTLKSTTSRVIVGRDFGAGFLVVMPNTAESMAVGLAEGWRFESGLSEIISGGHSIVATLSIGVLQWNDEWSTKDLIRRVYKLLFEAQSSGGNRVISRRQLERSAGS